MEEINGVQNYKHVYYAMWKIILTGLRKSTHVGKFDFWRTRKTIVWFVGV